MIEVIPESFEAISSKKLYNVYHLIRKRMTDHKKVTFAKKFLPMSHLACNGVISHVTMPN